MPGYGLSDDWAADDPGMDDAERAVLAFADRLETGDFYIYGAATGAHQHRHLRNPSLPRSRAKARAGHWLSLKE